MSDIRWTPGRWVAGFGHQHAYRVYLDSLDGPVIADCNRPGPGFPTGEAQANANLIAAAPDMYASLEDAARALRQYAVFLQEYAHMDYPAGKEYERYAMAALAKAPGGG